MFQLTSTLTFSEMAVNPRDYDKVTEGSGYSLLIILTSTF